MLDTQEKNLMLTFLQRSFPTHRLKHNMRFKRTIIMDNGEIFYLSDKSTNQALYFKLFEILNIVFASDNESNKIVLKYFLNLK